MNQRSRSNLLYIALRNVNAFASQLWVTVHRTGEDIARCGPC
jgi:hypothetical protein